MSKVKTKSKQIAVFTSILILYALLCAKLPFEDDYIPDLFKKIRAGKFTFPPHVSEECQQLISSMLVVDQLKRSTIAEIRQHPWVKKNLPPQLKTIPPIIESSPDFAGRIISIDQKETMATAIIGEDGLEGMNFVTYFHLHNVDGEWLITSKATYGEPA